MIRKLVLPAALVLAGCAAHSEFVDDTGMGKARADCLAVNTQFHPAEEDGGLRQRRPECEEPDEQ